MRVALLFLGVIVRFHGTPAPVRDRLHEQFGTKLLYRSTSQPSDWVIPIDDGRDEAVLKRLCARYRKIRGVDRCTLNKIHERDRGEHEEGTAPKAGGTVACASTQFGGLTDKKLLTDFVRRKLTPFWAQEYIGADLAKEAFAKLPESDTVPVGMIDGGILPDKFKGPKTVALDAHVLKLPADAPKGMQKEIDARNAHGAAVANLFLGEGPMGIGAGGMLAFFHPGNNDAEFIKAADAIAKAQVKPKVLNVALGLGNGIDMEDALTTLSEHTLVVASAGNAYPDRVTYNAEVARAILVTSLAPSGATTHYANYSSAITIASPSDDWILSHERFSGTSGAAPAVSGALTKVLARLGALSLEQAKALLAMTALPTRGTPMLNDYKLLLVAEKLRALGWRTKTKAQRDELLKEKFDFSKQAATELADGQALIKENDCDKKALGLKALRRAFLLGADAGKDLAATYRALGFSANAEFYESFDDAKAFTNLVAGVESSDADIRATSLRGLTPFVKTQEKRVRELLTAAIKDASPVVRTVAALEAKNLAPADAVAIIERARKDAALGVRRAGTLASWDLPEDRAMPILTAAMKDFSEEARVDAVRAALNFKSGVKLLELGAEDASVNVRYQVAGLAGDLENDKELGVEILMRLAGLANEDDDVLSLGARSAEKIGGGEAATLFNMIRNPERAMVLDDKTRALYAKLKESRNTGTRHALEKVAKAFAK